MIKNIIFDLSEVIISGFHKAEYIVEKNTNIKAEEFLEQRKEVNDIFLDAMRRKYTEDEYIEALLKSANWNVSKEIIKKSIRQNLDTKVEGTMKIVEKLKQRYNLILLSDHIKEWVDYIIETNKELEIFEHKYFSYEYGKLKTDEGTFRHIIEQEKIIPSETIFIDDSEENVEIAKRNGVYGIVFKDAKQLESELQEMNII